MVLLDVLVMFLYYLMSVYLLLFKSLWKYSLCFYGGIGC